MANANGSQGGSGGGGSADQGKIKVGEKEYTAADVDNLIKQASTLGEKAERAQRVLDAAEKLGLEPDELLGQAMGSFSVVNDLMKAGIIDEEGNIVEKKAVVPELGKVPFVPKPEPKGGTSVDEIVAKVLGAIDEKWKPISDGLEDMKHVQSGMIRERLEERIKVRHPDLNEDDVAKVFRIALSDKRKDLWEVAKGIAEERAGADTKLIKAYAEKHGLDFDKLIAEREEALKLKEKGPEGGAAFFLKGKKISLRQKGGDFADPLKLTREYFQKSGLE